MLVAGAVCLIMGAHLLLIASVRIARRAGLSPFFIGATLVAFGTSVPELGASLYASLTDRESLALGNVIGSNIANLALVLGAVALLKPIQVPRGTLKRDLMLVVLVGAIPLCGLLFAGHELPRWLGYVLLVFLAGYLWMSRRHNATDEFEPLEVKGRWGTWSLILAVFAGPLMLWAGSWLFIESAASIGKSIGMSEATIGLTLVAFTTSLPELVTSLYATARGYAEVGIGNILGSCVMNVLAILGVVLLFNPIELVDQVAFVDIPVLLAISMLCFVVLLTGRRVTRAEGGLLVSIYIGYIVMLVMLVPTWFPA